ncbi:hypothetical protein DMC61_25175 [Amycolatopsis sp. WAC 04169]|uniref:nuclear transport factor 2 family protein n=1 Tax=Amycolatopsis sp. WAC 04169 TaxID=2203197 RepID=UPI000F7A4C43|nr:nuclear transport factor 2 family protein [Amycolatopsis sp. WAC 04169]RSN27174.1 hypothetical protein DMC61_25175 [Amycolatopsis sp. WAC 04169]
MRIRKSLGVSSRARVARVIFCAALTVGCTSNEAGSTPRDATAANKELVTRFYQQAFVNKDVATAAETYIGDIYLQHNPQVADGKRAFVETLKPVVEEAGRSFSISRVIAEEDLVLVHALSRVVNGEAVAVADIFRVENSKIVEHWDVQQPIPAETASGRPMV